MDFSVITGVHFCLPKSAKPFASSPLRPVMRSETDTNVIFILVTVKIHIEFCNCVYKVL